VDKSAITVILSLATILFGWLFFRTNANHNKSEDVRKEMAEKVNDLYEENKRDRAQHNEDMRLMINSIHEMTTTISNQIKELNVMPMPDVKEYVNFKMEPVERLENKFEEVVKQVNVLIERSTRRREQ
jgi:archaellum component FlaC